MRRRVLIFSGVLLLAVLVAIPLIRVRAAVGWVGNLALTGSSSILPGGSFTARVEVWKDGVTNSGGQGAGITCTLKSGRVGYYNRQLATPTLTAMSYVGDTGNNDIYQATIAPTAAGVYLLDAYCTEGGVDTPSDNKLNPTVEPARGRALWLDRTTIAWAGATGSSYKLLYDPDGAVDPAVAGATAYSSPANPGYLALTASGTVNGASYPKNPNANGLTRLVLSTTDQNVKDLLKGEVAVAVYNSGGALIDIGHLQPQSVLDDMYASAASGATLGVTYSGGAPTVRVWAPTAKAVALRRYADSTTSSYTTETLTLDAASGVWSVTGASGWDRQFYLLAVQVYVPEEDQVLTNLVTDPYALSLSTDTSSTADPRSQFVDLVNDSSLKPTGWDSYSKPALAAPEDIVVYELHVRDFSINDSTVGATDRGTYLAFTYDGAGPDPNTTLSNGMAHLIALKNAGLTHIHLIPPFDIASIQENGVPRTVLPNPTGYGRASSTQQAIVDAVRATDGFNWGYDPYHYGVPEGSYSTNPDGATRVLEYRRMVQALNQNGLRVVMDMVYNHTSAVGQSDHSVLDKVVPSYYYRYTTQGYLYTDSCCSDTATEYTMMEKLMVDTLKIWAQYYKVDGFRFDLMNFHTRQNMLNVKTALQAIDATIYLYGEGWDFGSAQNKGLTSCPNCYAKQWNMAGTGIGSFNDRIRDAAHGGYSGDTVQIRHQGFINGLSYDWNGYEYNNRFQGDLWGAQATLRSALAGSGNDYTDDPQESVPYVEKHDNETLFDQNIFKLPNGSGAGLPGWCTSGCSIGVTSMSDRVRVQNMGQSLVGLAQGVPFFQAGTDILRSKSLDRNSYDSGDWFNRLFWDKSSNNFGQGLPLAQDNGSRWTIMTPLLNNTALDPSTADMNAAAAHMREVLRLRKSSLLFRLRTEADVNARVTFYNTDNSKDGLVVMGLSDAPTPDLDASYEYIVVFFNANKIAQTYTISGANGFSLHPIQADGVDADPVVQTASFNDTNDTFSIPARTTAVFVSATPLDAPSSLGWVGRMWPRGGVSNQINQGGATGNFDVYIQVYKAGVTDANDNQAQIVCTLHYGKYGAEWSDVTMAYNTRIGNNYEYKGTITQATLNALTPGTYGFISFCRLASESGVMWKQDAYNLDGNNLDDDQGDGIITIVPSGDPKPAPAGGAFVHLFEWRWADIEKECYYLALKGYSAVQVSPPNEHLVPTADMQGVLTNDFPWWARYQPITHDTSKFTSRSGSLAEFQSMVNTCNSYGVSIYVDAVLNQMAYVEVGTPPTGMAGTQYDNGDPTPATRFYGTQYQADDFHTDCNISDYFDRLLVQTCKLTGLPDLNTGKSDVQLEERNYLQALINLGVKGFRIDGGKHIAASDLAAIFNGLTGDFYVYQEVIDTNTSERIRDDEYAPNGDAIEFRYSYEIGQKFNGCSGTINDLQTLSNYSGMLPTRFAQIFVDNHDNQRGHGAGGTCIVDHRDGATYTLANVFMLAYPYGYPAVMSSYYWSSDPATNTGDSLGPPSTTSPYSPGSGLDTRPVYGTGQAAGAVPENCSTVWDTFTYQDGKWVCEHRNPAIANMVGFRKATDGQAITNWQNIAANHIAFGRGTKGFVAINRTASPATTTYQTSLPAGSYCDVLHYDLVGGQCLLLGTGTPASSGVLITVGSDGRILNQTVPAMSAFAIYAPLPTALSYSDIASSYGVAWHQVVSGAPYLGSSLQSSTTVVFDNSVTGQDGVSAVGSWYPGGAGGGQLRVTVNQAAGYVTGWIDWDGNGSFADPGERVMFNEAFTAGQSRVIAINVPVDVRNQTYYMRFRVYSSPQTSPSKAVLSPSAGAVGGEVEDGGLRFGPTAATLERLSAQRQSPRISPVWLVFLMMGALFLAGAIAHKRRK